jgi:hypothetical protein
MKIQHGQIGIRGKEDGRRKMETEEGRDGWQGAHLAWEEAAEVKEAEMKDGMDTWREEKQTMKEMKMETRNGGEMDQREEGAIVEAEAEVAEYPEGGTYGGTEENFGQLVNATNASRL